eukprot:1092782-Amphidinium_carterae.2
MKNESSPLGVHRQPFSLPGTHTHIRARAHRRKIECCLLLQSLEQVLAWDLLKMPRINTDSTVSIRLCECSSFGSWANTGQSDLEQFWSQWPRPTRGAEGDKAISNWPALHRTAEMGSASDKRVR